MARGLQRAAAYLPRASDGRRRVRAPDEDALTMIAAALERAGSIDVPTAAPATVRQLGGGERLAADALEALLGSPVRVLPSEGTESSLARALQDARGDPGPSWIVVAELRDRPEASTGPPGDGAAALLVDEGAGAVAVDRIVPARGTEVVTSPLAELFRLADPQKNPQLWTGDWGADPKAGRRPDPRRDSPEPASPSVSQGAFVPQARYDESRPSRWRFVADRCEACGRRTFPARGRCRECGRADRLVPEALPRSNALVLASTWIGPGGQPTEFDRLVEESGPYGVVLAEIAPGIRVTLTVADARPDDVRIGARVDTALRRLYPMEGSWRYGRKAVPVRP